MVKKVMYQKIQQLKKQGLNKSQIGKKLDLNRKTVRKYYDMCENDYHTYMVDMMYRDKKLDSFKQAILNVYQVNGNRKLNMAAVYDYMEEKFGDMPCSENTFRYYISYLLQTGELAFTDTPRVYSKVPDLPLGKQMQLDFGMYKQSNLTLYIYAALLSGSRFKYVAFQDTPFTTKSVIEHTLDAFDYFQGRPEELVIDQDRVMVVSENAGDLIYTRDFSHFIHEMDIQMYVCRKADPESKGKVENLVKYIKQNFLGVRTFSNVEQANSSLRLWLIRRANGKISQATGRIPLEVIVEERKVLRPLKNSLFRKHLSIHRESRLVSEHCLISYQSSNYSVPSIYRNKSVDIYATDDCLFIYDGITGHHITEHEISLEPGQQVINRDHKRDKEKKARELKRSVSALFELSRWREFCELNYKHYPRYVRDQCLLGSKYFTKTSIDCQVLMKALNFCVSNRTYSFPNLINTYEHYLGRKQLEEKPAPIIGKTGVNTKHNVVSVKKRPVSHYNSFIPTDEETAP